MAVRVIFGPTKSASAVVDPQDHAIVLPLIGLVVLAILVTYILWPIVTWSRRRVREYLEFRREEHQRLLRQ
jgi:uncharacterized Tic20 family protein